MALKKSGYAYNIIGISQGSYVAIELARLIEEIGGKVSLVLIDGPLQPLRETLTKNKSLDVELFHLIQGFSTKILTDTTSLDTFFGRLGDALKNLELTSEKEIEFKEAFVYIHHNLSAMLEYDHSNIKLKGPLTIIKTGQKFNDPSATKVINNYINFF